MGIVYEGDCKQKKLYMKETIHERDSIWRGLYMKETVHNGDYIWRKLYTKESTWRNLNRKRSVQEGDGTWQELYMKGIVYEGNKYKGDCTWRRVWWNVWFQNFCERNQPPPTAPKSHLPFCKKVLLEDWLVFLWWWIRFSGTKTRASQARVDKLYKYVSARGLSLEYAFAIRLFYL